MPGAIVRTSSSNSLSSVPVPIPPVVQQDIVHLIGLDLVGDMITRGAGNIALDCLSLADEAVKQRRFACIRLADNSDSGELGPQHGSVAGFSRIPMRCRDKMEYLYLLFSLASAKRYHTCISTIYDPRLLKPSGRRSGRRRKPILSISMQPKIPIIPW